MRALRRRAAWLPSLVLAGVLAAVPAARAAHARSNDCDSNPTGVQASDHWLDFEVPPGSMPDPRFDGRDARLRVHAVVPVYAHGKCRDVPNVAAVLVHGRTTPGSVAFDLRVPARDEPGTELPSTQVALAEAGIHTFAPDLLGYGASTRFADGLDDPCNASRPDDRTRNAGIFPLDQQGHFLGDGHLPVADGLGVNPLGGVRCAHSSSTYFADPDVFARDVEQVIDDAIARVKPRGGKVALIGYSFGGASAARTLYRMGEDAGRKVRRVVFLSSVFNRFPGVPRDLNMPTEEAGLSDVDRSTSFPLTLSRLGGWSAVPSSARDDLCTGRVVAGAPAAFRESQLALDPLGASWGGSDPDNPTGLLRSPTFALYGWNPSVAATIALPTLVVHGVDDTTAPVQNADNIYDALSVENKTLLRVECGSHQAHQEGCSQARCDDNDAATVPYGGTSQTWLGPHSTIAAAMIEWIEHGTLNGSQCGRFTVDHSGVLSDTGSSGCAAVG